MYEAFYKLKKKPFSMLPDPEFLYLGEKHSTAFAMLEYGLESRGGFTVVTGEVGSGKTTLVRHLLTTIDADTTVGLISNTHSSFGELLQWVLLAYGLDFKAKDKIERYKILVDFLISEHSRGKRSLLIVDEAQNMDIDALEELRLLSNLNADKSQIIQLIMIGQPEFVKTLRRAELTQFTQRIAVDYHLDALSELDTHRYIRHRLNVAGRATTLFEAGACALIHRFSRGIPRLINVYSDTSLVYGYSAGATTIDTGLVLEVIKDKARSIISSTRSMRRARAIGNPIDASLTSKLESSLAPYGESSAREAVPHE